MCPSLQKFSYTWYFIGKKIQVSPKMKKKKQKRTRYHKTPTYEESALQQHYLSAPDETNFIVCEFFLILSYIRIF